jgi:hypothetical protein
MKYKRIKTDCYKVVPVIPLEPLKEQEKSLYKKVINELTKMNKPFLEKGRGRKVIIDGEEHYRDVPNVSYKIWQQGGKLHQYMTIAKGEELQNQLMSAMQDDIESCRFEPAQLHLVNENLFAFAIQGLPSHAIVLDKDFTSKFKSLFSSVSYKDQLLYNLTVKELEDHNGKRKELKKRLSGYDPDDPKSVFWYGFKQAALVTAKGLYNFWVEDETKKKHKEIIENLKKKGCFQKSTNRYPLTMRKLAEKNRYVEAEVLFLLWTTEEGRVQRFREKLQRLLTEMQGENELQVVPVKPDLERVKKGHLQYDLPHLTLYQKELDKFLYLPCIADLDSNFYAEHEQKTEISLDALQYELGGLALGRKTDTNEIIALPRTVTETDLDDRGTPTLISGKKGSGKTQLLINQVADTFCFGADNIEEWREKARSVVVFDVADGDMLREIYELVPDMLKNRVILLNHADLDNPLPITNHDVLNINKIDGFEEEIATMETQMLMDSLGDKNQTVAVERYFKMALQASYLAGDGNLIDAMCILEDAAYRSQIIGRLRDSNANVFLPRELQKMDKIFTEPKDLEIIDNRISRLKNTQPWIDALAQKQTEGLDFWKWINGDEDGAYLVLIYIPKRINKSFRSFLFAHYFMKLWYMTEAREIINKADRKEFLVIVDELHQIFGHRVVPPILEAIYKESRKYRGRYVFTLHGWSSIKDKEVKDTIKDASGNYILLKGGDDMFSSLEKEFKPYTVADFNNLMKLSYTGLFKIDIKKRTNVFQAQLMEPASIRFKKHRSISLAQFRSMKNKHGRPKHEVRAAMLKGVEKSCNNTQRTTTLDEELDMITGAGA